jgi:hypothetical protein
MLLLSAVYGLLMRLSFVVPMPSFGFNNVLQGHSHVAFLGWGYLTTIGLIYKNFLTDKQRSNRTYRNTLIIIGISVVLMLISFLIGGYGLFSVILLSIFGFTSYVLSYRLLRDLSGRSYAVRFIRYGIYYYLLSSLATWFLAGVILTQGKSDLYYNTVYFYLHFLYNGYFVFVLFGMLLKWISDRDMSVPIRFVKPLFVYLNVACIPTYALSVLWSSVGSGFYIIGFAGACLQLAALWFLWAMFRFVRNMVADTKWLRFLIGLSLVAFSIKVVLQLLSSFPYFVNASVALKPYFIVGYLHLFTLAFMTVMLLVFLAEYGFINVRRIAMSIGLLFFVTGLVLSELLLFGQGFMLLIRLPLIPGYFTLIFAMSAMMFFGLVMIFLQSLLKARNTV